ncbi:MAG: hypothetical protein H6Q72_4186 [Firmicutes bacterium]|nr:hypothetical protein [Bacillota bacterium]
MPTVECERKDCERHGIEICIAKRIKLNKGGDCSEYRPRIGKAMLEQPFNSNCHRRGGKYKSSKVTGVLK